MLNNCRAAALPAYGVNNSTGCLDRASGVLRNLLLPGDPCFPLPTPQGLEVMDVALTFQAGLLKRTCNPLLEITYGWLKLFVIGPVPHYYKRGVLHGLKDDSPP